MEHRVSCTPSERFLLYSMKHLQHFNIPAEGISCFLFCLPLMFSEIIWSVDFLHQHGEGGLDLLSIGTWLWWHHPTPLKRFSELECFSSLGSWIHSDKSCAAKVVRTVTCCNWSWIKASTCISYGRSCSSFNIIFMSSKAQTHYPVVQYWMHALTIIQYNHKST